MPRFDAVLFDLDDTLHDDDFAMHSAVEEVAREIAAEHEIDVLALKDAYIAEAMGFWQRLSPEMLKERLSDVRTQMWRSALGGFGIADDDLVRRSADNYNAYRKKYFTLFPGALDLLRTLRADGVKLGLVTNGFAQTHREKIALLQLADVFDALFFPDETGLVKPDPLLFAHACTKLERAPSRSAMVGDRYDRDIRGAKEAGLFAVWLNIRGESVPPGAIAPDATVDDLGGVRRVLIGPA